MNDDLIKRSDAIEAIELVDWYHQNRNKDMVHGANSYEHQAWYKSQDIYEALENVPSTNRPQGEWISHFDDLFPEDSTIECSICHEEQPMGIDENYCPHCGARMKRSRR